ncbi:MAG: ketosynthase chain-length factor [Labedaea sp.]
MNAVVTGLGVVSPTGIGVADHWANTLSGTSGIDVITRFDAATYPATLAGEVRSFNARDHVSGRMIVATDRWTQMALAATEEALRDAGAFPIEDSGLDEYEMAVVTASSSAGNEFGQGELGALWSKHPQYVTAYQSIAWFYAATTGQISIKYGMRGSCGVIASEQAGGLDAIAQARRVLRGRARLVVSGGTEAPLSPYAVVCQQSNGMLSHSADPATAYLPFDAGANGYVPGEGGAILIVEDEDSAQARGVSAIYGRVAGYAATFDPRPGSGREPTLRRAAELAIAEAGLSTTDIDVVFADAFGVPELDRIEAEAISTLFGPRGVPVTAPKTLTGRLYAGGAALDLVTALLSIREGVIPPTFGVTARPELELDLVVNTPRETTVRTALVLARGYGGFNSAVVLTAA